MSFAFFPLRTAREVEKKDKKMQSDGANECANNPHNPWQRRGLTVLLPSRAEPSRGRERDRGAFQNSRYTWNTLSIFFFFFTCCTRKT